ncbi:Transposable element Tcb2 transposase [Rhizoctonia solani]|uniref:Transposable element Tcb2 transposase n=1 Tax=Rhizoctonia solani TaxID=456999 RepID=A0A8H8NRN2_9AGAM|nr:Transposable element Tcb2 transposase [Rhizoctonia solani]QRW18751.1 Transposable element Tcb2 transposase [Rhizoctonia solani]
MVDHGHKNFAQVAGEVGRDATTVSRIYKRYHQTQDYNQVAPRSGCPCKFTESDARRAIFEINKGGAVTASQLQREIFPHVSADTIERRLKEKGLECCKQRKVPLLSKRHVEERLAWGESLFSWTLDNWSAVVYSDASQFNIFGSDGYQRVWRMPGESLDPKNTTKKVAHGGGNVMVWGCITRHGVGCLQRITTKLDLPGYARILTEDLLGSLSNQGINPCDIYFQRDKDRKQWTKLVATTLKNHHIDSLPWPAASPDMNIIENLWDHLDGLVHAQKPPPTNKEILWRYLREEWEAIDQGYINSLYESIPTRVMQLVQQRGGNTEY